MKIKCPHCEHEFEFVVNKITIDSDIHDIESDDLDFDNKHTPTIIDRNKNLMLELDFNKNIKKQEVN